MNAVRNVRTTGRSAPKSQATPIVFVVDDDFAVREALDSLIREAGWEPRSFSSAQEFLSHHRVSAPNCLVLDVTLPGLDGLELQSLIAGDRLDMPIIFITGHADVPMSVKAMKAGAVEFLTKPVPEAVLLDAIENAIARSRIAVERETQLRSLRSRHAKLTPREREVMALVVRGLLNKQVAGQLGMAEITVKAHRGQIMRKMDAASFADLVNMASRLGLAAPTGRPR
jgi:FixJ family two-component response regulator